MKPVKTRVAVPGSTPTPNRRAPLAHFRTSETRRRRSSAGVANVLIRNIASLEG